MLGRFRRWKSKGIKNIPGRLPPSQTLAEKAYIISPLRKETNPPPLKIYRFVILTETMFINSLKNNGFELLYIEPNWLFIYWNIKESKNLTNNINIKKEINNHKYISTDTYKPSGNFIYEDSSLMNMNDKFKS